MFETLTKDELRVITALYKEYRRQMKLGTQRIDAVMFGDASSIKQLLDITISDADVDYIICSLDRKDYVECFYADDTVNFGYITDKTICEMEHVLPELIAKGIKTGFDVAVQLLSPNSST